MKEDLHKTEKDDKNKCDCDKFVNQNIDIACPIEIKPDVEIVSIKTLCCGEPKVECISDKKCNTVKLIITQTICVQLPIKYSAVIKPESFCIAECSKPPHSPS